MKTENCNQADKTTDHMVLTINNNQLTADRGTMQEVTAMIHPSFLGQITNGGSVLRQEAMGGLVQSQSYLPPTLSTADRRAQW